MVTLEEKLERVLYTMNSLMVINANSDITIRYRQLMTDNS